jgi:hypothetical protein
VATGGPARSMSQAALLRALIRLEVRVVGRPMGTQWRPNRHITVAGPGGSGSISGGRLEWADVERLLRQLGVPTQDFLDVL